MQTIYLDISNKGVVPTIYAKQGDVGRKFLVVLTDSGIPYVPPAGSVFSVWYDGASGEGNYTDVGSSSAVIVNANTVKVELITQMLQNEGEGKLCLVLNNANGDQISSWNISYICEAVPGHESEEAKAYFTAFSNAVQNLPYPDVSLSTPGKAADAAAVGAALNSKAPAGFGLGSQNEAVITSLSELDNTWRNGWYKFQTFNEESIDGHQLGLLYVNSSTSSVEQIFVPYRKPYRLIRVNHTEDGWGVWEYENPPMVLGVEYRTTERWNNKVVYAKSVNVGTLPDTSQKTIEVGIDGSKRYEIHGHAADYSLTHGVAFPSNEIVGYIGNDGVLHLTTLGKFSSYDATVTIKYVKD